MWSSSEIDLAIMKVNHEFEHCAELGNSDELKIGENIFSIGSPISYDFKNSVSSGIISGLNRNLKLEENNEKIYINNLIQTDIGLNPGNSGGALINEFGQIVGITTVKITSAENMSFSVPINVVKPVIKRLEESASFEEVTLGIMGYDKYSIESYNSSIDLSDGGVFVAIVNQNSTAEKSGIKSGDIIVSVNDNRISDILDLRGILYEKKIGDEIILTIKRDRKEFKIKCGLDEKS